MVAAGQPEQARSLSKAYKPYSSTMEFVLNGRTHSFDAETVRARVATVAADPIRTHWVEITVADGHQSRPCIRRFGIR